MRIAPTPVDGHAWILKTHFASAVPARDLHTELATLADQAHVVQAALDMLISGF
jgi:hypothetical protein